MKDFAKFSSQINVLLLSVFLLSLILIFRNEGLYPSVFADEYASSTYSRLLPLGMSLIPNYLYLKLFSVTNACGDGFLECARLINAALFSLAIPFIYLTCRAVAGRSASMVVTLLAVAGPINSYTAYFMPESTYFFSFWVFVWFLLKLDAESRYRDWIIAGVIYGACALIKPHAVFFSPAIVVYIGYIFQRRGSLFSVRPAYSAITLLVTALLVKFSVGYLLAGSAGVTMLGPLYNYIATNSSSDPGKYIELFKLALESVNGHLFAVALIYGLPLALSLTYTVDALLGKSPANHLQTAQQLQFERTVVLALAVIFNLIVVVGLFTAAQANPESYESPYRLHLRYYNFALPLFYIVAAGALARREGFAPTNLRYAVGGIIVAVAAYAIHINLAPYTPNIVDSPELSGLHTQSSIYPLVGGLLVLALATWMVSEKAGIQLYLYFSLPIFVVTSAYSVAIEQRTHLLPDVYDKAGLFAKQYLTTEAASKTLVIASEPLGLFHALFHLDTPFASYRIVPAHSDIDVAKLAPNKEWLLIIGDHRLPEGTFFQQRMNGFTLARVAGSNAIDFRESFWPGIISGTRGLSSAEPWGTWSDSDVVVFEFASPLPEKFELHLLAHAFGPNVDGEFKAVVGASTKNFKLRSMNEEQVLAFDNPDRTNVIEFVVPKPTSLNELGLGDGTRKLGMGFVRLEIMELKK